MDPWTLRGAELFEVEDLPLEVLRRHPQPEYPLHKHDFSELIIVYAGEGTHFWPGGSRVVKTGDVYTILDDEAHGYRDIKGLCLVNLIFDVNRLRIPFADLRTLPAYRALFTREAGSIGERVAPRLFPERLEWVIRQIQAMEAEQTSKAPGFCFNLTARFMLVVGFLSRLYTENMATEERGDARLDRVLARMSRIFPGPIELKSLAREASMSESALTRAFKKRFGLTPVDYYGHMKIRRACALLKRGGLTVTETANSVGFIDPNYFSRQFRRIMGVTPSAYRKSQEF